MITTARPLGSLFPFPRRRMQRPGLLAPPRPSARRGTEKFSRRSFHHWTGEQAISTDGRLRTPKTKSAGLLPRKQGDRSDGFVIYSPWSGVPRVGFLASGSWAQREHLLLVKNLKSVGFSLQLTFIARPWLSRRKGEKGRVFPQLFA